ncbi:MAG: DUF2318 domain-containing protein [Coriobacteriales bacterium]|nr:DUF2318 domain-containing protein [Coriobacteriales bacterium]
MTRTTKFNKMQRTTNKMLRIAVIGVLSLALFACDAKPVASSSDSASTAASGGASSSNNNSATTANNGSSAATPQGATASSQQTSKDVAQTIAAGDSLRIPLAEVSEKASFYPVNIDGTTMEVLAVKAPDGTVRTAFNTCEVCYDSGRGYYKQDGDALVCQNCGNRFKTSQVEVESNGCNPWPIFAKDKTVDDNAIIISYEFLSHSTKVFANWKRS